MNPLLLIFAIPLVIGVMVVAGVVIMIVARIVNAVLDFMEGLLP